MITTLNFELTEPELLQNYTDYLRIKTDRPPVLSGKPSKQISGYGIESSFGRFFNATVRGGNAPLIPDFDINVEEISAPLAQALGIPLAEGESLEAEIKVTRGGKGGSTIGQRSVLGEEGGKSIGSLSLTSAIKTAARQADPGIDIENKTGVLKAARKALGGAGKFFNLIRDNDPDLFMKFYQKAKLLQITKFDVNRKEQKVTKANVISISFPFANFTAPPFAMEVTGSSLVLKLGKAFENKLIQAVLSAGPTIAADSVEDFQRELAKLPGRTKTKLNAGKYDFSTIVQYPSGASIPMTKGKITGKRSSKGHRRRSVQRTITSAQLTASIQRSLFARMPKGPVKGPPLSDEILTNRTGNFVKNVFAQVRGNLIRYYYDPIYQVHESTGRAPSETIEGSIRNITQRQVGRQFNILKGF